jgi:hypothetical protein
LENQGYDGKKVVADAKSPLSGKRRLVGKWKSEDVTSF